MNTPAISLRTAPGPTATPAPLLEVQDVPLGQGRLTIQMQAGELRTVRCPDNGQTTALVHTLAGWCRPQSGSARLDGQLLYAGRDQQPAAVSTCGVVSGDAGIGMLLSGHEYLSIASALYGNGGICTEVRMRRTAGLLKLRPVLPNNVGTYSRSERVKLALVAAMIGRPRLYLCDEPLADDMSGPDSRIIRETLAGLHQSGAAILIATTTPDRYAGL